MTVTFLVQRKSILDVLLFARAAGAAEVNNLEAGLGDRRGSGSIALVVAERTSLGNVTQKRRKRGAVEDDEIHPCISDIGRIPRALFADIGAANR
jgi:hypothetical protein